MIAILDWELSTVGNPLMDAIYVIAPFWNVVTKSGHPTDNTPSPDINTGLSRSSPDKSPYAPQNRAKSGIPGPDELMDIYAKITGFDPRQEGSPPGKDFEVAKIFHYMRGGTISHGIQARTYAGQASSEFSHVYFDNTRKSLDAAWEMVERVLERDAGRAKL